MKIAVIFEFSGRVRDAFNRRGHEAVSYDLLPSETCGPHIQGDVRDIDLTWADLVIAHPPCTHLAVSGARWFKSKQKEQKEALDLIWWVFNCGVSRLALENPVSIISTKICKPTQIIQPYQFGDPYKKTTCLWLRNLPPLVPTNNLGDGEQACWKEPPSPDRWKNRSRTYPGIAEGDGRAMGAFELDHDRDR